MDFPFNQGEFFTALPLVFRPPQDVRLERACFEVYEKRGYIFDLVDVMTDAHFRMSLALVPLAGLGATLVLDSHSPIRGLWHDFKHVEAVEALEYIRKYQARAKTCERTDELVPA